MVFPFVELGRLILEGGGSKGGSISGGLFNVGFGVGGVLLMVWVFGGGGISGRLGVFLSGGVWVSESSPSLEIK